MKKAKFCLVCSKPLNERHKRFCDIDCFCEFQFQTVTRKRVESGLVWVNSTLHKYLCKVVGNVCNICNIGPVWNGKVLRLQVDHIDGNSDNNFPNNLRLLCPNCHSQTDTFTNRQKKNNRRNRYLRKFKGYVDS